MYIHECNRNCIELVESIIKTYLSYFHSYYASSCIESRVCRSIVAYEDRKLAGVGVFYSINALSTGVIYYVTVLPDYRNRHIGKAIVVSIEEILSNERISVFLATTRKNNIMARKMLNGLGYVEIDLDNLKNRNVITMLTCGYEDDLLYLKTYDLNVDSYLEKINQEKNLNIVENVWRNICYIPWTKIRRKTKF